MSARVSSLSRQRGVGVGFDGVDFDAGVADDEVLPLGGVLARGGKASISGMDITRCHAPRLKGAAGLALCLKVGGAAPGGPDECRLLGVIARAPYRVRFSPAEAGQPAYFLGRWINTRGVHGPVSDIAAATVAALI